MAVSVSIFVVKEENRNNNDEMKREGGKCHETPRSPRARDDDARDAQTHPNHDKDTTKHNARCTTTATNKFETTTEARNHVQAIAHPTTTKEPPIQSSIQNEQTATIHRTRSENAQHIRARSFLRTCQIKTQSSSRGVLIHPSREGDNQRGGSSWIIETKE